jgi:CubicO group peptidase (beta-lactamase class C family)
MLLVERGLIALDDPVADYVPEFAENGKADVRIRHLLTHTSGLPDMLPHNDVLRASHVPFECFVEGICRQPLLFPPGTRVHYQSMGFAMLAEMVRRVEKTAFPEFLARNVFQPLGMSETSLGWRPETAARIAAVQISDDAGKTDWHWNSPYWLGFGAPWGGLITTPSDLGRFCRMMLDEGSLGRTRILGSATVRAMTLDQLVGLPLVPEEDRRCRPWGLGWRMNWPGQSASFGDLLGPSAYGHWGATGTLFWIDPDADAFCVILTTRPQGEAGQFVARFSNCVVAALG